MPVQYAIAVFGTRGVYHKKAEAYVSVGDLEAAKKVLFNELDFLCAVGKAYGDHEYWLWGSNANGALGYIIKLAEGKLDGEWLKIAYERAGEIDNELIAQLSRIHVADDIYLPSDTNGVLRIDWPKHWLCRMLRSFPGYADYSFNLGLTQAYMRSLEGRIGPDAVGTDFCSDFRNRDISWQEFFKRNWAGRRSVKNDLIAFRQIAMGNLFKLRANRMRIAFHLYRLQHGKWPDGFADLDPSIEIPKDPFDGKELRYNSEHRYFWTPGDDGDYDGTLDFDDSGRPLYTYKSIRYVELLEPKRTKPVK